ncbi:hypothetical protein Q5752_001873 [Cryptotrichosporon argae]
MPPVKHHCTICNQKFSSVRKLSAHNAIHMAPEHVLNNLLPGWQDADAEDILDDLIPGRRKRRQQQARAQNKNRRKTSPAATGGSRQPPVAPASQPSRLAPPSRASTPAPSRPASTLAATSKRKADHAIDAAPVKAKKYLVPIARGTCGSTPSSSTWDIEDLRSPSPPPTPTPAPPAAAMSQAGTHALKVADTAPTVYGVRGGERPAAQAVWATSVAASSPSAPPQTPQTPSRRFPSWATINSSPSAQGDTKSDASTRAYVVSPSPSLDPPATLASAPALPVPAPESFAPVGASQAEESDADVSSTSGAISSSSDSDSADEKTDSVPSSRTPSPALLPASPKPKPSVVPMPKLGPVPSTPVRVPTMHAEPNSFDRFVSFASGLSGSSGSSGSSASAASRTLEPVTPTPAAKIPSATASTKPPALALAPFIAADSKSKIELAVDAGCDDCAHGDLPICPAVLRALSALVHCGIDLRCPRQA